MEGKSSESSRSRGSFLFVRADYSQVVLFCRRFLPFVCFHELHLVLVSMTSSWLYRDAEGHALGFVGSFALRHFAELSACPIGEEDIWIGTLGVDVRLFWIAGSREHAWGVPRWWTFGLPRD